MTLIQSRNLVYRIFKFDMYSFVKNIAIEDINAVLLGRNIPIEGFIIPIDEIPTAQPPPMKISVVINKNFHSF